MGSSLAVAKPTTYRVKNIAIMKNNGAQLPVIANLPVSCEYATDLGQPSFTPMNVIADKPKIHKKITANWKPKVEYTPNSEKTIIATGKMNMALTDTALFFACRKPKANKIKKIKNTQIGVFFKISVNALFLMHANILIDNSCQAISVEQFYGSWLSFIAQPAQPYKSLKQKPALDTIAL